MGKVFKLILAVIVLLIVFAVGIQAGRSMLPPADQAVVDAAIEATAAAIPTQTPWPTYTPQPTSAPIIVTVERVIERERVITVAAPEATAIRPLPTATRPARPTPTREDDWATGGTLHDGTIRQWLSGSDRDKLATAGDWAAVMLDSDVGIGLPATKDEMKVYALQLVTCIGEAVQGEDLFLDNKGAEWAFLCGATLGFMKN